MPEERKPSKITYLHVRPPRMVVDQEGADTAQEQKADAAEQQPEEVPTSQYERINTGDYEAA